MTKVLSLGNLSFKCLCRWLFSSKAADLLYSDIVELINEFSNQSCIVSVCNIYVEIRGARAVPSTYLMLSKAALLPIVIIVVQPMQCF